MKKLEKCDKCNKYILSKDNHICKNFIVFHKDIIEEEGKSIYSENMEEAAIKYSEWYDSHFDYDLMNGEELSITVIDTETNNRKNFLCTGECTPIYNVEEIE